MIRQRSVQPPEVAYTAKKSSPDIGLRDVMPAFEHALHDAGYANLGRIEEEIDNCDREAGIASMSNRMTQSAPGKRGFEHPQIKW